MCKILIAQFRLVYFTLLFHHSFDEPISFNWHIPIEQTLSYDFDMGILINYYGELKNSSKISFFLNRLGMFLQETKHFDTHTCRHKFTPGAWW